MRVLLLVAALVGCSNVEPEVTTVVDSGTDASVTADEARWDAWQDPDVEPYDALASAESLDAASCATRADACGDASNPLDAILNACANKYWSCGHIYFRVDTDGCVSAVAFDTDHRKTEFETCVVAELAAKRFACVMPGTVHSYLSCTVK